MTDGLTIRPYRYGDEHKILETFNLVFREVCGADYVDRTMEQWQWAYPNNPAGHRISLAVAEDGTVTILKNDFSLLAGEIIDSTFMSQKALVSFLEAEVEDARQSASFSLST